MVTDLASTFDESADCIKIVGYDMSKEAARQAYEEAQVGPEDVQVIELHDCFSANELITYEALGLAEEGHGHELVDAHDTTYGGRWVVNPSGGLISKGHPLGATGLAQCSELVLAAARAGRCAPGRRREGRAAAQHRPRRRGRRDGLQAARKLTARNPAADMGDSPPERDDSPREQTTWPMICLRYVLPAAVLLGGLIVMALGSESDLEGGAGIVSAGLRSMP